MEQEKIEIIKPKTDKLDYSYKVLSNGLKVLLISDSDAHKSAAALAVNIGSLVDKKDEQGLAHFCEHLLMMGSKKYPKEDYLREYLSKKHTKPVNFPSVFDISIISLISLISTRGNSDNCSTEEGSLLILLFLLDD